MIAELGPIRVPVLLPQVSADLGLRFALFVLTVNLQRSLTTVIVVIDRAGLMQSNTPVIMSERWLYVVASQSNTPVIIGKRWCSEECKGKEESFLPHSV